MTERELAENIAICKEKVEQARMRGKLPDEVTIVGASKTMDFSVIDMVDRGRLLKVLGENRAQELVEKYRENQSFEWHFIGVLQSNKVKTIIDKVSLIHSVDRLSLAKEISLAANKIGKVQDVLIQLNMGREESKSGFNPEDAMEAISKIKEYENIRIRGIMAVMPIAHDEKLIELYTQLREIFSNVRGGDIDILSAGMTNDYELAIEYAGANMVRIGRAIFGERCYK